MLNRLSKLYADFGFQFTIKVITVKEIGSIGALYDAVVQAGIDKPVEGNYQGSYLTMRSKECLYFGILHVM
jgi:Na+/proline symporter